MHNVVVRNTAANRPDRDDAVLRGGARLAGPARLVTGQVEQAEMRDVHG
jgi:hypothetical protein